MTSRQNVLARERTWATSEARQQPRHLPLASQIDTSAAEARDILADGLYALAPQPPDKTGHAVEQLIGPPAYFGGFVAPFVEKQPAVIEGEPPIGFRRGERFLMIEPRPDIEIHGRNAISGEARAFLDCGFVLFGQSRDRGGYRRKNAPSIIASFGL